MTEREMLIDELVAKAGPTVGQIKLNQDPGKIARLLALGWEPGKKEVTLEARVKALESLLEETVKKVDDCSVRR